MDEPGDDGKLRQLLFPGLRPNIVRRYVSGPVDPVPGSGCGNVLQEVLHRPQRQVTLTVGSPVASLPPLPAGRTRIFTATQRGLAVCSAAGKIVLSVEMVKSSQVITFRRLVSHSKFPGKTLTFLSGKSLISTFCFSSV